MNTPIWELFRAGTDTSVPWVNHGPNHRFAIYSAGAPGTADDLVLDKETGLVWPRNANLKGTSLNWLDANTTARELRLGNRIGWRLPTVEELSSVVDTTRTGPALPSGHPFLAVQFGPDVPAYWTSTNHENATGGVAWFVNLDSGAAGLLGKHQLAFAWPVRGGRGGVNWNA